MNYLIKEKLKDRLEYCLDWRRDTELYLVSVDLTDTVNNRYYEKRPLLRFLLRIFNLIGSLFILPIMYSFEFASTNSNPSSLINLFKKSNKYI